MLADLLEPTTPKQHLTRRMLILWTLVFPVWFTRIQAQGFERYVVSAFTLLPFVLTLLFLGIYLRRETDTYEREQMVWSLLAGAAGVVTLEAVRDCLRPIAAPGELPPFTGCLLFAALFFISLWAQRLAASHTTHD